MADDLSDPDVDGPGLIWHYTDSAGLIGILSNSEIWATQVGYLNDTSEVEYALSLAKRALRSTDSAPEDPEVVQRVFDHAVFSSEGARVFVACFCADGDLLSQWRGYAGDDGFAIGFDPEAVRALAHVDHFDVDLVPVEYGRLAAQSAADLWVPQALALWTREFPDGLRHMTLEREGGGNVPTDGFMGEVTAKAVRFIREVMVFSRQAAAFKDDAFREEKEWRLIASMHLTRTAWERLGFRPSRHGVVPYVTLPIGAAHGPSPMREVKVGPGLHGPAQTSAVRLLLQKHGVSDDVDVTTSRIPYRR